MPPNMQMPMGMGSPLVQESGTNLLSVLINIAFGFVTGLMVFFGAMPVIAYGSKIANDLIQLTGYGAQTAMLGGVTTAVPFVVLAPIGAMVLKEIASVRSIKSFAYFAAAVALGFVAAFISKGYFASLIGA